MHGSASREKADWVFIKTHMHGGPEPEFVNRAYMDAVLTLLENMSSEGRNYKLHYVTARET